MNFAVIFPLYCFHNRHPLNLFFLALFTIAISLMLGVACGFSKGETQLFCYLSYSILELCLLLLLFNLLRAFILAYANVFVLC